MKIIEENELRSLIEQGKTIWNIMKEKSCSKELIRTRLLEYGIKSPKGFYRREGKKPGCPKGTKRTESELRAMSERVKGHKNPFFGKTHNEDTKKLMSTNHADFSGDRNPFRKSLKENPNKVKEHSDRKKVWWASLTSSERDKLSEVFSKAQCNNSYHQSHSSFKNHKHGHHTSPKAGKFFYRSSWELKLSEFLDENPKVLIYSVEPFVVPYQDQDGKHRYTRPDFWVRLEHNKNLLIEVKPKNLLNYKNNPAKIEGCRLFCERDNWSFQLITDDDLDPDNIFAIIENHARRPDNAEPSK